MRIVRTVAELRDYVAQARVASCTVGLVPTMGALHAGHRALIEASSAHGRHHVTIVSIFVNPRQFGDAHDLDAYPRTLDADAAIAEAAGADLVFSPGIAEVYPDGFATEVRVSGPLTERLEGAHRGAAHFHGVTTVVTKLLNMVQPDTAFFGAKDAQQVRVIQRLVRDLNLPVEIAVVPTVRATDGLALSSRNVHLAPEERQQAAAIPRALQVADELVRCGERNATTIVAAVDRALDAVGLTPEYVAVIDPETLLDQSQVEATALLAVAVPVGQIRLIDNLTLEPVPVSSRSRSSADRPFVVDGAKS